MKRENALHDMSMLNYIHGVHRKHGQRLISEIFDDHEIEVMELNEEIDRLREIEFMYEELCL